MIISVAVLLALLALSSATAFALTKLPVHPVILPASETAASDSTYTDVTESVVDTSLSAATDAASTAAAAPSDTLAAAASAAVQESVSATTTTTTTLPAETTTAAATTTTAKPEPTTTQSTEVVITGGTLTSYPAGRTDRAYTIPYSVTKIGKNAFNNTYLQTLTFSKREDLSCDWANLFACLPNLKTIYIYAGTSADTVGMHYFDGEIIYYYD